MSPLATFLEDVGDEKHARLEVVDGKRVLIVSVHLYRKHISNVNNLVHYAKDVAYAVVMARTKVLVEIHPPRTRQA